MGLSDILNIKTFNTLVQDGIDYLVDAGSRITNFNRGGVTRILLEVCQKPAAELYGLVLTILPQGFVKHATGAWLDLHAEGLGVVRIQASKGIYWAKFGREDAGGDVPIPAATIVSTNIAPDGSPLRYFTIADALMEDGTAELLVEVRAEFAGSRYNLGAGYLANIDTPIAGVDTVTNDADWTITEGVDEEENAALRTRCISRWNELGAAGNDEAYEFWAKSVAGVADVKVLSCPRGPGTVDVIITGAGGMPSAELIEAVQAYIDARAPLCADILVRAPQGVDISAAIAVYIHPEYGDEAEIQTAAEEEYEELFDGQGIGVDYRQGRYIAGLWSCSEYVEDIKYTDGGDQVIDSDKIAINDEIIITVERLTEL